jgi:hypothetical protein
VGEVEARHGSEIRHAVLAVDWAARAQMTIRRCDSGVPRASHDKE